MFHLTLGYINESTIKPEEAIIVKSYLERDGFSEWFSRKAKLHKAAQRSRDIVHKLKKAIHGDGTTVSDPNSDYSWQQIDMSTPHSFGNEGVGLTQENNPYSKADRHKVCR